MVGGFKDALRKRIETSAFAKDRPEVASAVVIRATMTESSLHLLHGLSISAHLDRVAEAGDVRPLQRGRTRVRLQPQ